MPPQLAQIGTLQIGAVLFTTDPRVYEPLRWPRSASVHEGLNGALTVQDFGTFKKRNRLHLESGDNFLPTDVVQSLLAFYTTKGATHTLKDWLGNEFTVYIADFRPVEAGLGGLWRYTMELVVLDITKLLGVTYVGS